MNPVFWRHGRLPAARMWNPIKQCSCVMRHAWFQDRGCMFIPALAGRGATTFRHRLALTGAAQVGQHTWKHENRHPSYEPSFEWAGFI